MGNTPSVPPPGGQKPKPEIPKPKVKPKNVDPLPKPLYGHGSLEYMGF